MSERIYLFSNGTQYMDWTANNCDRCTKAGDPSEPGSSKCELFEAIHDAATEDGTVAHEIAKRIGLTDAGLKYVWRCPELHLPTMPVPLADRIRADIERLEAWNTWARQQ
jgi:hypothetical protein